MTTVEQMAVRKTVTVAAAPEQAFALFTERIADWWPFPAHSLNGAATETAVFEPFVGGRVYERARDGSEAPWGRVVAYDRPSRFVLEWKVNPEAVAATELEVRFEAEDGGTRVDLEHRGWERLREKAEESRASYDTGWEFVLGEYAGAVRKERT